MNFTVTIAEASKYLTSHIQLEVESGCISSQQLCQTLQLQKYPSTSIIYYFNPAQLSYIYLGREGLFQQSLIPLTDIVTSHNSIKIKIKTGKLPRIVEFRCAPSEKLCDVIDGIAHKNKRKSNETDYIGLLKKGYALKYDFHNHRYNTIDHLKQYVKANRIRLPKLIK